MLRMLQNLVVPEFISRCSKQGTGTCGRYFCSSKVGFGVNKTPTPTDKLSVSVCAHVCVRVRVDDGTGKQV